ncbi:hypothetical protein R4I43_12300 [Saccharopolyspora sp. S2-29]|uniref:Uncharacterized protein n=1 Tax=Saccharopolyspora mangrovi TaxID=3082379 RepID=A0ABU6A9L7_9PSEU|nr:hypothetical protein [Saccharopolyspora sp. S2-29]MEB3368186.1 hypothetical protein [Saccharopolyspora sp. S2-29]
MADWNLEIPAETGCQLITRGHRSGVKLDFRGSRLMGKRARKKKDRRKNKANHGKRPNS